jgi:hypothetical protein
MVDAIERPAGRIDMPEWLERVRPVPAIGGAAVVGSIVAAAILATGVANSTGTSDISKLDCDSEYVAVGSPFASRSYRTPREAAAAYAEDLRPNGEPVPEDFELIELTGHESPSEGTTFAVRVDGRTVALLGVEGVVGSWSVGGDEVCS